MKFTKKRAGLSTAILLAAVGGGHLVRGQVANGASQNRAAPRTFAHALPRMDGANLKVTVVEVVYAPGQSSRPHSHPCPVIGYVAEGAIRFQVKGEPETVYKAGESFYEAPNGVHLVSANASDKEPAKLIAYFTCDHETPLTVAPPAGTGQK
jgi:quercetin dioxygenase-like cupin family protein